MSTKITLTAFLMSMISISGIAQVSQWAGTTSGEWEVASNWTPAAPTANDSIYIPENVTVSISTNVGSINRLGLAGKLLINANASLSVDQTVSNNNASIVRFMGGELENLGTFTVKNSVGSASNSVIYFNDHAVKDNLLNSSGVFNIDNTTGAYAATTGRVIGLGMISPDRISSIKLNGTINFNIKSAGIFIETNGGGNLTLDGTFSIGSPTEHKDLRLFRILNGGSVTIAPTADIKVYTAFSSATNGVINLQSALASAPGASFNNFGKLQINGGPNTAGYGIYFNPGGSNAINTLNNAGTITVSGTFPGGFLLVSGTASGVSTVNNQSSGVLTLFNADPSAQVIMTAAATNNFRLNNEGLLRVSSADITLTSTIASVNNSGTIAYNYILSSKKLLAIDAKIWVDGQNIVFNMANVQKGQLQLIDLTGKIVAQQVVNEEFTYLNRKSLKGIYILRFVSPSGSYMQKVSLD